MSQPINPQQIDRELVRTVRLAPLDAQFDARVLAQIDTLPRQIHNAELAALRQLLAREQRRMRWIVGSYTFASVLLLSTLAEVASRVSWPVLILPSAASLSTPIAALAVLGAGAWLFARDRRFPVLSL